jgi:hypothetical protein
MALTEPMVPLTPSAQPAYVHESDRYFHQSGHLRQGNRVKECVTTG